MPRKAKLSESEAIQAELLALKIAMGVILDGALTDVEHRDKIIDTMAQGAQQIAAQLKLVQHDVVPERLEEFRALVQNRAASVIRGAGQMQRIHQRLH